MANGLVLADEHHAPPVGLDIAAWCAYPADRMSAYPVSTRVNSPRNDDPALIEHVA